MFTTDLARIKAQGQTADGIGRLHPDLLRQAGRAGRVLTKVNTLAEVVVGPVVLDQLQHWATEEMVESECLPASQAL
ncbi:MAG: hypothetical protein EBV69_06000 [Oxalobacteraceae bacterium]|nr:hypothetical protein [Oxalobacteraceae bacterium]